MAFTLQAIQGSDTLTLTSLPYSLLGATGMGGAAVRRVTAQGPKQRGDTDLGYRLLPRQFELRLGIKADTDALLDGYRDDLVALFKPLDDDPVQLRVTRDDGEVRALDCYLRDEIRIDLIKEHRPGHYHVVTVPLVAPDPTYYGIAPGTVSSGTVDNNEFWYLAGGAIGTAHVKEHGEFPTQGQAWTYTDDLSEAASWQISVRTGTVGIGTAFRYMYYVDNPSPDVFFRGGTASDTPFEFSWMNSGGTSYALGLGTSYLPPAEANYHLSYTQEFNGDYVVRARVYHDGTAYSYPGELVPMPSPLRLQGTVRRWRSDATDTAASRWPDDISRYVVYSPRLNSAQQAALDVVMADVAGTIAASFPLVYEGDVPEYPVISIAGPISSPAIINETTQQRLDFGTISIAPGSVYVVDLRYGYKSVTQGTVSKLGDLTADSDLGDWHLAPNPAATGGTNVLSLIGTAGNDNTEITVTYYNRYTSF